MEQDLISIIVAIYNVEDYIEKCISSIVQQTYRNLEIILVDDGSLDNCPQICDRWMQKDDRIKVIHKKNGGLSNARNVGMENAHGKYIAFVDGDDWIAPEMYEILHHILIEKKCSVSVCDFEIDDGEKKEKKKLTKESNVCKGIEFLERIAKKNYPQITYSVWKFLYESEKVKKIKFIEGRYYEDVLFSTEVLLCTERIAYINEALYYYTIRNTSITKTNVTDKHIEDLLIVLDLQNEFIEKKEKEVPKWIIEHYFWQCIDLKMRSLELEQKRKWLAIINSKIKQKNITYESMSEKTIKNFVKYVLARYGINLYVYVLRWMKQEK